MKVQGAYSAPRGWLPVSSASGLSPGGLLSTERWEAGVGGHNCHPLGQKNRPSASLVMFSSMFMPSLITDINLSPWCVRIIFLCGTCIRREEKQGAEVVGE